MDNILASMMEQLMQISVRGEDALRLASVIETVRILQQLLEKDKESEEK